MESVTAAMIGYLLSVVVANIASVRWSPVVVGGLVVRRARCSRERA
jgi:hypothetical protein